MKVVVFDLGGTLMEFKDMPPTWSSRYKTCFVNLNKKLTLNLTEEEINKSVDILKSYNPRTTFSEIEIAPTEIFGNIISNWNTDIEINDIINCFFEDITKTAVIFDYAPDMINYFKLKDYKVACLSDLPNGMPDYIFKKSIKELIEQFDLYVSSQSCGYRKPNKYGLKYIADYFNVDIKDLLFIGDEEKDELTAKNANCKFRYIGSIKNDYKSNK